MFVDDLTFGEMYGPRPATEERSRYGEVETPNVHGGIHQSFACRHGNMKDSSIKNRA